jgi:hypothetical protein
MGQLLGNPLLWLVGAARVVAVAALPPLSARLRQSDLRLALAPFVLADLGMCGWLVKMTLEALRAGGANAGEAPGLFVPALLLNVMCAICVAARVLRRPADRG